MPDLSESHKSLAVRIGLALAETAQPLNVRRRQPRDIWWRLVSSVDASVQTSVRPSRRWLDSVDAGRPKKGPWPYAAIGAARSARNAVLSGSDPEARPSRLAARPALAGKSPDLQPSLSNTDAHIYLASRAISTYT